jgi:hypothetical protein
MYICIYVRNIGGKYSWKLMAESLKFDFLAKSWLDYFLKSKISARVSKLRGKP